MKSKEKESVQWEAPRIRNHGEHPDNRGHVKRGTMASKTNFLPLIEDPMANVDDKGNGRTINTRGLGFYEPDA